MTGEQLADEMELDALGDGLAQRLLGQGSRAFCCHFVKPKGPGDWYRYTMLPGLAAQPDVEARSHAAAVAVLVCWRLEYQGQEAPPELRALAARVLADGGAILVGKA